MTCWNDASFDTRLSDRTAPFDWNVPPGSEKLTTMFQYSWSVSRSGSARADGHSDTLSHDVTTAAVASAVMAAGTAARGRKVVGSCVIIYRPISVGRS